MALPALESGVIHAKRASSPAARWMVTGRSGGRSAGPYASANLADHVGDDPVAVEANRRRLARSVGAADLAVMRAEHGARVISVESGDAIPPADAMVTATPGLAVVALAADCATIALVADDDRTISVVHCGWRGLVLGVVRSAITALRDRDVDVAAAVVGPAICGQCYPVPADRVALVRQETSSLVARVSIVARPDGQVGLDVGAGVVAQVRAAAPAAAIVRSARCTFEDPDLFSYRRDTITGRHGLVVLRQVAA